MASTSPAMKSWSACSPSPPSTLNSPTPAALVLIIHYLNIIMSDLPIERDPRFFSLVRSYKCKLPAPELRLDLEAGNFS